MNLDCLVRLAVVGRPSIGTPGERAANNSPGRQDACTIHKTVPSCLCVLCTIHKILRNSVHGNEIAAPLHKCACTGVAQNVGVAQNRCPEHQCIFRCVRYTGVLDISVHICEHIRCRVCTCACVCAVCAFVSQWGTRVGGVR